jgi:bacterioferritin-associated ferredoxin
MIVCSCNRLTDTQVRDAIHGGAGDTDAVYAACGCQKQCGCCGDTIAHYLDIADAAAACFSLAA